MPPNDPLRLAIQQPLERVLGARLTGAWYYTLPDDAPAFALDEPNASSGCQGVRLEFAGGDLELDWDSRDRNFRDEAVAYYLAVRAHSEREAQLAGDTAALVRLDAAPSSHWRRFIGERLLSATAWGFDLSNGNGSPQAVTLTFPSGEVIVAIGMCSAGGTSVGDGDEVLLFDDSQWQAQPTPYLKFLWASRRIVQLDGRYRREEGLPGGPDYCAFELPEHALRTLARLCRGDLAGTTPVEIEIGEGHLRIEPAPPGVFAAELSGASQVLIRASPLDLRNLAQRLEAMADAVPSPEYLPHVHLDNQFSEAPVGLSDIVVERRDGSR